MSIEFKVMPWLRALRDRNAKEQEGLSVEERLQKSRTLSAPLVSKFLRAHPEAMNPAHGRVSVVAEPKVPYGGKLR